MSLARYSKKLRVNKGGQTVICSDDSCNQPRAYVHCHKLMEHHDDITAKGQAEVIHIAKKIEKMVVSNENKVEKKIQEKPCFTFDNFFSGEFSLNFLGSNGYVCERFVYRVSLAWRPA